MRVLVFGASITQGFWDTEGGWVQRLRRYYDEKSVENIRKGDDYPDIFNLGISADTSADVLKRFRNETAARKRSEMAILFCMGTNNAMIMGRGEWHGAESYKQDLEKLVSQAREFTPIIMFVGLPPCEENKTTPVFWGDYNYTNERIKSVDEVMRNIAKQNNLPFVSIFEQLKEKMENGEDLFADGLHPNNEGHQLIFELVQPELDKLLAESSSGR
jgi:acyl-CoA thioesterase-1